MIKGLIITTREIYSLEHLFNFLLVSKVLICDSDTKVETNFAVYRNTITFSNPFELVKYASLLWFGRVSGSEYFNP